MAKCRSSLARRALDSSRHRLSAAAVAFALWLVPLAVAAAANEPADAVTAPR
jgi:hypothetical protein